MSNSANSPLGLTTYDSEKLHKSGLTNIFQQIKDDLVVRLEKKYSPKTKYDTQIWAMAIMNEAIDEEKFNSFKKYLFENGKSWEQFLTPASILLRDYYLEKHKEITD
ncbi:MAG: hypothetical protein K2Q34_05720 [Alphaproteobacteria bacterium]|nr:hypothetical protein [Alphaproteobacteria bacterium]